MIGKLTLQYSKDTSKTSRSFRNFIRGISTDSTKTAYVKFLGGFMNFHNILEYDEMVHYPTKKIDILFEDFIDELESRESRQSQLELT